MIRHHPSAELLLDYTSGALDEAVAMVVAGHIALCGECRARVRQLEAVGGALLEMVTPVAVSPALRARILASLEGEPMVVRGSARSEAQSDFLPPPIRARLPGPLDSLRWKRVGRLYEEYVLPISGKGWRVSLLCIPPGRAMPEHDHRGREYTLVLAGSYRDGRELFRRGDFDAKEHGQWHRPVAGHEEPCLCLVVMDAPVKLRGLLSVLNPFLRF